MLKKITWNSFEDLSVAELYEVLKLRSEIFVVEQECPYLDPDGEDLTAFHGQYFLDESLAGYLRVLPPSMYNDFVRIGRIAIAKEYRNKGLGIELMQAAKEFIIKQFKNSSIKLSAQLRLQNYYSNFGFEVCGLPYDDVGVMHIDMVFTG